jgi:hypothetical protein
MCPKTEKIAQDTWVTVRRAYPCEIGPGREILESTDAGGSMKALRMKTLGRKTLGVIMTAVAITLTAPADGAAQADLSGTWDVTVTTQQGAQPPFTIVIVQDGQDLIATGDAEEMGRIEMAGTLDGSSVRFQWDLYIEGNALPMVFVGTIADDGTIAGTADFGGFSSGDWFAKRAEG